MGNSNTIRQCAEIVEINIATAFFWRYKIIDTIRKFVGYGSLEGVIELDETYFALSYNGSHSKSSNFTMPRESRKRSKEINTRGIACVLCGVDRLGNIYTGLICDGRPKYTDIDRDLSDVVEENSILCTDKHRSYIPFAAQHNFELHQIRGERKTVEIYNIQRVNAFHSSLKRWINKFNGVSTKYLTNYLFWYKWSQLLKTEMERNKPKKFFIHANSTHSIFLIKDLGSLLGIVCHDVIGECRPFMVLENVIVKNNCRGLGIGKSLMNYIENYAREINCYYTIFISAIDRKKYINFMNHLV